MKTITDRQAVVLSKIQNCIQQQGVAPSVRQLAAELHINTSAVHGHIQALIKKGYLVRDQRKALHLTEKGGAA